MEEQGDPMRIFDLQSLGSPGWRSQKVGYGTKPLVDWTASRYCGEHLRPSGSHWASFQSDNALIPTFAALLTNLLFRLIHTSALRRSTCFTRTSIAQFWVCFMSFNHIFRLMVTGEEIIRKNYTYSVLNEGVRALSARSIGY